jgi:molybdopterin converting factor small subunit
MSVTIQIPTPLRTYTGQAGEILVEAGTVGEALQALVAAHPGLGRHLYTDEGKLRSFVNVFVNDHNMRELGGEAAPVAAGDQLLIIPAIAGGRS